MYPSRDIQREDMYVHSKLVSTWANMFLCIVMEPTFLNSTCIVGLYISMFCRHSMGAYFTFSWNWNKLIKGLPNTSCNFRTEGFQIPLKTCLFECRHYQNMDICFVHHYSGVQRHFIFSCSYLEMYFSRLWSLRLTSFSAVPFFRIKVEFLINSRISCYDS